MAPAIAEAAIGAAVRFYERRTWGACGLGRLPYPEPGPSVSLNRIEKEKELNLPGTKTYLLVSPNPVEKRRNWLRNLETHSDACWLLLPLLTL
jgi:hypothetical protein